MARKKKLIPITEEQKRAHEEAEQAARQRKKERKSVANKNDYAKRKAERQGQVPSHPAPPTTQASASTSLPPPVPIAPAPGPSAPPQRRPSEATAFALPIRTQPARPSKTPPRTPRQPALGRSLTPNVAPAERGGGPSTAAPPPDNVPPPDARAAEPPPAIVPLPAPRQRAAAAVGRPPPPRPPPPAQTQLPRDAPHAGRSSLYATVEDSEEAEDDGDAGRPLDDGGPLLSGGADSPSPGPVDPIPPAPSSPAANAEPALAIDGDAPQPDRATQPDESRAGSTYAPSEEAGSESSGEVEDLYDEEVEDIDDIVPEGPDGSAPEDLDDGAPEDLDDGAPEESDDGAPEESDTAQSADAREPSAGAHGTTFDRARAALERNFGTGRCRCNGRSGYHNRTPDSGEGGATLREMSHHLRENNPTPDAVNEHSLRQPLTPVSGSDQSDAAWCRLFCGSSREAGAHDRRKLSLAASDYGERVEETIEGRRWWDIDAAFIPLRSLAAHREAFKIVYQPSPSRGITANWHFRLPGSKLQASRTAHTFLGRGVLSGGYSTAVFFPGLPAPARAYGGATPLSMPQRYQEEWVDNFLLPSLRETFGSELLSHHTQAWEDEKKRAEARRAQSTTDSARSVVELSYDVPDTIGGKTGRLAQLWRCIKARLDVAGPEWQGARLMSYTYGCKLLHRTRSLRDLQARYRQHLQKTFHLNQLHLPDTYVDLAHEDIFQIDGEPLIAVWRSACNEASVRQLGLSKTAQYFPWHGTADGSSVRAETPMKADLRDGGVAYMQAYMTEKGLWVSPDRSTAPLFGELAYRDLGFTQATLQKLHARRGSRLQHDHNSRQRAIASFRSAVDRVAAALTNASFDDSSFGARREYRISFPLFEALNEEGWHPFDENPDQPATHMPYYLVSKRDALAYLNAEVGRWVTGISAALSGRVGVQLSEEEQHCRVAMLSMLFACLELVLNSGSPALHSRLARDRYRRRHDVRPPEADELWDAVKTRSGKVRPVAQEDSESEDEEHDRETSRNRRGLALMDSLRTAGMYWLPHDMFDWTSMSFDREVLPQTAFVNGHFRRRFGRFAKVAVASLFDTFKDKCVTSIPPIAAGSPTIEGGGHDRLRWAADGDDPDTSDFLVHVCYPLWNACCFSYCNYILTALEKQGHLKAEGRLSPDEARGRYGLSYGIVSRALGYDPLISYPRGGGGNAAQAQGAGFSGIRLDLSTRLQLLFDWGADFDRGSWGTSAGYTWRVWFRESYEAVERVHGARWAACFRVHIGEYIALQGYITCFPRYEKSHLWKVTRWPHKQAASRQLAVTRESKTVEWLIGVPRRWASFTHQRRLVPKHVLQEGWTLVKSGDRNCIEGRTKYANFVRRSKRDLQGFWLRDIDAVAGRPDRGRRWREHRRTVRGLPPKPPRPGAPLPHPASSPRAVLIRHGFTSPSHYTVVTSGEERGSDSDDTAFGSE